LVIDQYIIFAILAVMVATMRYGTYLWTIYKGETKPHAFSWLLWGIVTGIGTLAQFQLNGGPSAWALAFVSITCLMISVLSFFIGEKNYTKSDWFALIGCFVAITMWQATDNPMIALGIIIVIDCLTYWPTIRKSYLKPDTEPPVSYFFAGLRYFLILFAVPDVTWQTLMYPFFLMATDWGFGIYIIIRRAQLNMPLHEYSKKLTLVTTTQKDHS
jgi:hypothetical protein